MERPIREGLGYVVEWRYFHMSNAGLTQPNHGFNGNILIAGLALVQEMTIEHLNSEHFSGMFNVHCSIVICGRSSTQLMIRGGMIEILVVQNAVKPRQINIDTVGS